MYKEILIVIAELRRLVDDKETEIVVLKIKNNELENKVMNLSENLMKDTDE